MKAVCLALLALLLLPAAALAQDQSVVLEVGKFDRQLTHVPLKLTCQTAAPCAMTLVAKWSMTKEPAGTHATQPLEFLRTPWTVPGGQSASQVLDVSSLKFKQKVLKAHATRGALLDVSVLDASGQEADWGNAAGVLPRHADAGCHLPRSFPYTGGGVVTQNSLDQSGQGLVYVHELDSNTMTIVGDEPITATYYGVSYTFAPHSRFSVMCGGLTDYAGNRSLPVPFLFEGSVRVTGNPHNPQYYVTIETREGSLGSRSSEKVDFTVSRNTKAHTSTLHFDLGRSGQITPQMSKTRSPCTSGSSLMVDRRGKVHKVR